LYNYASTTDLIPEFHKRAQAKESLIRLVALIGLMSALKILWGNGAIQFTSRVRWDTISRNLDHATENSVADLSEFMQ